jgi:hypothetical protein
MPKFIFEMPDDMSALVEAFRIRRGHKATAVAVRELISTGLEVAEELKDCVFDRESGRFVTRQDGETFTEAAVRLRAKPEEPKS